jgi:hypothetical protein
MNRLIVLPVLLSLAGCDPTELDRLRMDAPTIELAPPADYPVRAFGAVVTGYGGSVDGTNASRVAVSAGANSPFSAYPLLIGDEVRLESAILDGCNDDIPCEQGAGTSLAGLPVWGSRQMCLAVPEPDSGHVRIRCEDDSTVSESFMGPVGVRFGEAAAAVPADHPFGRAIFGAPDASFRRGAVYVAREGQPAVELDLSEGAGAGEGLGTSVAIAILDEDTVILAASAPVGAVHRVIVATTDVASDGSRTTRVRDCLDETSDGWGAALAFGDLNGDGAPELIVGSGDVPRRLHTVRVYDGAAMPAAGTCDGAWPSVSIACPSIDGVICDDASAFGRSVAAGDLDADGDAELIVGAPSAEVNDVAAAGAVFVFAGTEELDELESGASALVHSHPTPEAALGTAVAVAPGITDPDSGVRRDEVAAGAPGVSRAYVFLCSGVGGDTPQGTGSPRCQ